MTRLLVGPGVLLKPRLWAGDLKGRKIFLVSDKKVFSLFGAKLLSALKREGFDATHALLPEGERAKSWDSLRALIRAMVRAGLGRDSCLLALGGGTVTDAAGFAAAIYLRGIPWVSLPTTFLGQVDSGIGGKTGINLEEGKNLVGAFHQPLRVVCDTALLHSLPMRERVSGLAEAIKCGLAFDPGLWKEIRNNWGKLLEADPRKTAAVIRRTAAWKVKIVARDERETKGPRELLNFGHTLGHALETVCGHGVLRHGEAVIWGMRAALLLSRDHAGLAAGEAQQAEEFLKSLAVPVPRAVKAADLLAVARRDKKARGGRPRFILLRRVGKAFSKDGLTDKQILGAIKALLGE